MTFGQELYTALKRHARGHAVVRDMNYADIQKLKSASREEVLELFRGSHYDVLQRIKKDAPEELADYLGDRAMDAEHASRLIFLGAMLGAG